MRKLYIILSIVAVLLAIGACKDVNLLHPYGENDGQGPAPVSDVTVQNRAGGAVIKYSVPKDPDLAYVRASFTGTRGDSRNVTVSGYIDSLIIDGLGDTREYLVEIRAYDRFENPSEAVIAKVNPDVPVIMKVYESLTHTIDFGGFIVGYENETNAKIGIYVLRKNNSTNELEYYDSYFTEQSEGSYPVRGLPAEENEFGLYITDKWNNTSDTLIFRGTPIKEEQLEKKNFKYVGSNRILGDVTDDMFGGSGTRPDKLYNGKIANNDYCETKNIPLPNRITIDLGVNVKLSRLKVWPRPNPATIMFQHKHWRLFKIYGATELLSIPEQDPNDVLKGWTLIGDFESIKPSGLPIGQVSEEDIALATAGEEFRFNDTETVVRYIRIEVNAVHSYSLGMGMSEMTLWGNVQE